MDIQSLCVLKLSVMEKKKLASKGEKNCFDEIYDICFLNICEKHPLIGENCIQSLKNMDFAHFHSFYKGSLRQKSLK